MLLEMILCTKPVLLQGPSKKVTFQKESDVSSENIIYQTFVTPRTYDYQFQRDQEDYRKRSKIF